MRGLSPSQFSRHPCCAVHRNAGLVDQFIELRADGIRLRPWSLRYRSPTELDELVTAAGLVLEQRWATWDRDPFTSSSPTHISVYRR